MTSLAFVVLVAAAVVLVAMSGQPNRRTRPWICLTAAIATAAYIVWRWHSLAVIDLAPPQQRDWVRFCIFGETIFIAEFWIFLLLASRTSDHSAAADRHQAASHDGRPLPRVDVFIATYDEELAIVEKSICGALALDWPEFRVFVLDDGRRDWLRDYCARVGAEYITRADNRFAKAGNHNHALSRTDAPLIAVFDADFVPCREFLRRTVGFFADHRIGIVQTPQVFYNDDNFRKSLQSYGVLADDQRFFFRHVMPCRDAWGVAFYVGSSAVLRREALAAIGGVVTGMATEDQATSAALLSRGYRTLYLNEPLSSGLAPESSFAAIEQRKRWCRGGIQLAFKRFGPFGAEGGGLLNRLFFIPTFWVLGFANPVFFLAEIFGCWATGYTPFVAVAPMEILIGSIAIFATFSAFLVWVGRGTWMPLVSPALQLFLAISVLPVALGSVIKPWGRPLFKFASVTPKGEAARAGRINWRILAPISTAISALAATVASAVFFPLVARVNPAENMVLALWTAVAFAQLFVAASACFEPPYQRGETRFPCREPVVAWNGDSRSAATLLDISLSGARIAWNQATADHIEIDDVRYPVRSVAHGGGELRLEFHDVAEADRQHLIERLFSRNRPGDTAQSSMPRAMAWLARSLLRGGGPS